MARVSKSFGEAHPRDEETKTQQHEEVCHTIGTPSFTLDIVIPDFVSCHLLWQTRALANTPSKGLSCAQVRQQLSIPCRQAEKLTPSGAALAIY